MNIKDIAKTAGVAVSTVSRVLNQHPDVKEDTRTKVLSVMEELNYIPNNSARNLKRSTSNNIGVMIKGRHNPFFSKMVESIEEKIAENGYSMILHYTTDEANDIESAIELIKEKRLKGLICLGGNFDQLDDSHLIEQQTPLVLASTDILKGASKMNFSSVVIDNERSAYNAVDYLCKLGHQNVGLITTGKADKCIGELRTNGYRKALADNGIAIREDHIVIGSYTFESGYNAAQKMLTEFDDITALFVTSDVMAIGACKAAMTLGKRVPEDLSLIGFDGLDYAEFYHPSISSVKQPIESMGISSANILMNLISGKSGNQHLVMETELVIRDSCLKRD